MKKVIALLLCVFLILYPLYPQVVNAEETNAPCIEVQSAMGEAGDSLSINVLIKNNPGVLGGTFKLDYDPKLSLRAVSAGTAFGALTLTKPGVLTSGCKLLWDATEISENDIKDGVILTLSFDVSGSAESGEELKISFQCEEAIDKDLNPVSMNEKEGIITIKGTSSEKRLDSISATKTKTVYYVDESLTTDDVIVYATYSDGTEKSVSGFVTNSAEIDMNSPGIKELVISFTDINTTKTTIVHLTVKEKESIGSAKIILENSVALPGDLFDLNLSISDNPGIIAMTLKLQYDSKLILVGSKSGDAFSALTMTPPGEYASGCKFVWDGTDLSVDEIKDGTFLTLSFKVDENAQAGDKLIISATCEDPVDRQLKPVKVNVQSGSLTIKDHIEEGHTPVIDKAVAPTCTKPGKTEGSHCSVCGEVIKAQEEIKATGHKIVTDKAVAATCMKNGLTEGKHCSVCGKVIKKQTTVKATGHTVVKDKAVAATYTKTGLSEGSHCSVCGKVITKQKVLPKKVKNGWFQEGGRHYYYVNGTKQKGWKQIGKFWYYFSASGEMQTGWKQISKKWYFFKKDGSMASNEWCQGYWLNKDGTWTYKKKAAWHKDKVGWWFGCTGWYAKNQWQKIDDKWYYFDKVGYITTGTKKIGKKTYRFDKNGVCLNP